MYIVYQGLYKDYNYINMYTYNEMNSDTNYDIVHACIIHCLHVHIHNVIFLSSLHG